MRVGEIASLMLDDIDFTSEYVRIDIREKTTKARENRESYISTDASEALKDYLTRYFRWKEDSINPQLEGLRIFGRTNKIQNRLPKTGEQLSIASLLQTALVRRMRKVPELNKLARNGRHVIHYHAFREYFYTQVSNVISSNYAHALIHTMSTWIPTIH